MASTPDARPLPDSENRRHRFDDARCFAIADVAVTALRPYVWTTNTLGDLMLAPNDAALAFLLTRRSRPAKTLTGPVPDQDALEVLLTAAARTPDHGKLEPWRFIVLEKSAMQRLAGLIPARGKALGIEDEKITKAIAQYANADLAVAVVCSPKPSDKIPEIEQIYSAGAVCLSLLNASLAAGWGANWLSGWASHDRTFLTDGLALAQHETIAGFIHIGTETSAPPERPRPEIATITTWVSA